MQDPLQQRLYERIAVTTKALESTSDTIIIADSTGAALYVNPAFTRVFGFSTRQLNVSGIPTMLFQDPAIAERIFANVRKTDSWRGEARLKTSDDSALTFLLNIDSIRDEDDQLIGFISIGTDITPHKRINAIEEAQRVFTGALLDTASALTSTLDLTEVFERILDNVSRVVPNDAANIILIEDGKARLVDRDDYQLDETLKKLREGTTRVGVFDDLQQMMLTQQPLVISNVPSYLRAHDDMRMRTPWLGSHIGIPIRLQDQIIGFLNVDSVIPGLFSDAHAERLQVFAEQASIAIHNARLHQQAQRLAMIEEGQRLSRNLHDAVSQTLFSANLIADALPALWKNDPEQVLPRLEQIRRLNRSALAEMRTLLLELNPDRLLKMKLEDLLQQLVDGMLGQIHVDVTLNVTTDLDLAEDIHVAAYYIAHEALNNIVKHAEARTVTITFCAQDDGLALSVRDDGCGFDLTAISGARLGLDNMRKRADRSAGELRINTAPGAGTEIHIHWKRGDEGENGDNENNPRDAR